MRRSQDWVTRQIRAYGYASEKSVTGGYWVNIDWDYEGHENWQLFPNAQTALAWVKGSI